MSLAGSLLTLQFIVEHGRPCGVEAKVLIERSRRVSGTVGRLRWAKSKAEPRCSLAVGDVTRRTPLTHHFNSTPRDSDRPHAPLITRLEALDASCKDKRRAEWLFVDNERAKRRRMRWALLKVEEVTIVEVTWAGRGWLLLRSLTLGSVLVAILLSQSGKSQCAKAMKRIKSHLLDLATFSELNSGGGSEAGAGRLLTT
jgi:hypothetical protein